MVKAAHSFRVFICCFVYKGDHDSYQSSLSLTLSLDSSDNACGNSSANRPQVRSNGSCEDSVYDARTVLHCPYRRCCAKEKFSANNYIVLVGV